MVLCFGKRFGRRGEKVQPRLREEVVESKGCRFDVALVKGPALVGADKSETSDRATLVRMVEIGIRSFMNMKREENKREKKRKGLFFNSHGSGCLESKRTEAHNLLPMRQRRCDRYG